MVEVDKVVYERLNFWSLFGIRRLWKQQDDYIKDVFSPVTLKENKMFYYFIYGTWTGKYIGYVAKYNGKVVGFIYLSRRSDHWSLQGILVEPRFQGLGVGKELCRLMFEDIDEDVDLDVQEGNTSAIKLYERLGFKEAEVWIKMKKKG